MIEAAKEEIFPSFPVWCADPASAARMVNAEKAHQGIAPEKSALLLGQPVCNSTTALGLRGLAALDRVRSRCTGKERDTESGLDHFGKRYYSSALGRWATPDPLQSSAHATSPQTLNRYSYAVNRPLSAIDLDGLLTIIIGGTFNGKASWATPEVMAAISQKFNDPNVAVFPWSGSLFGRGKAAKALKKFIDDRQAAGEQLNIVGHSHGGNVAKLYTLQAGAEFIDNLLTLGTPNRKDIPVNPDMVGNYVNKYSQNDLIQVIGGPFWCIFCVSRTDPNAQNVEVSTLNGNAVGHSDLHSVDAMSSDGSASSSGNGSNFWDKVDTGLPMDTPNNVFRQTNMMINCWEDSKCNQ